MCVYIVPGTGFDPTFTDNCTGSTIENDYNNSASLQGASFQVGTTTVVWTVTDAAGNTAECSIEVVITDDEDPTIVCNDFTIQLAGAGTATVTVSDLVTSSNDNCGVSNIYFTSGQLDYDCDDIGQAFTVELTIEDVNGNTSNCTADVTVADQASVCNDPPTAACQALTIDADGNCQAMAVAIDFDLNSFDPDGDPLTYTILPVGPYALGTTEIEFVVSDGEFSDTCFTQITVVDNDIPTIICNANQSFIGCDNSLINFANTGFDYSTSSVILSSVSDFNGTAFDNCIVSSISYIDVDNGSCPLTVTRIWTATDDAGNSNNCNQTFTIAAPTVSLTPPVDQTETSCQTQANIDGAFGTWMQNVSGPGGCNTVIINDNVGPPSNCGGSTTVTWMVTSDCEPDSSASATFTVESAPLVVLTPPVDATETSCQTQSDVDAAFTLWMQTVFTSGGCNSTITNDNVGAPNVCGGSTLVTWTVSSDCETDITASATFTVEAAPAITFNVPQDEFIGVCETQAYVDSVFAAWLSQAFVADGCNPMLQNNSTVAPLATGGSSTIIWTVSDNCEALSASSVFTVAQDQAPVCLTQDVTIYLNAGGAAQVTVSDIDNGSYDDCGIVNYALSQELFFCEDAGDNTITLTLTDAAGNVSSCDATVTVIDDINPTCAGITDETLVLNNDGEAFLNLFNYVGLATDNCGNQFGNSVDLICVTDNTFDCQNLGVNPVIFMAFDGSGNMVSCPFDVTIVDPNAECTGPIPTASCDDAIQNGTETGIDCGGTSCNDCACDDYKVYANETVPSSTITKYWWFVQTFGNVLFGSNSNNANGTSIDIAAGQFIQLNAGTTIEQGADVELRIDSCEPIGN